MVPGSSSPSEYFATSNWTSHHFVIKKNKSLDPGRRKAFANGHSEETDNPGPKIKEILKEDAEHPTILLVTDAEESCRVLNYLGISTSQWNIESGIKDLVHDFRRTRTHMSMSPQGSSHRERSHNPPYRLRSRSPPRRSQVPYADLYPTSSAHSPSPGPPSRYSASSPSYAASSKMHTSSDFGYSSSSRFPPARINSPSNSHRSYQPVYIVDIKAMYLAIGGVQSIPLDLHAIAAYILGKPINREQTCAGDESSLIIDCWESFARGAAVDEQNEERKRQVHSGTVSGVAPTAEDLVSGPGTSGMPAGSGGDDEDEDWDPNDALDQEAQQDAPTEAKTVSGTYADLIFGDDDDYGSEDDY
ncbi:hypothetical protein ONZ45_g2012 [Pleurotus djamor]|nr:hypothetical protein ONZ45_g2012 [Pleurotus djamor]